ncbi:hypothetical protein RX799_24745 [Klebsiella oxytoca]|uniref:hypothetical protein n=1 Tax=Klebsiella oxytoca TaxID=571 RepID=UPI00384AD999
MKYDRSSALTPVTKYELTLLQSEIREDIKYDLLLLQAEIREDIARAELRMTKIFVVFMMLVTAAFAFLITYISHVVP